MGWWRPLDPSKRGAYSNLELYKWATTIPTVKSKFAKQHLGKGDLDAECRVFRKVLLKELEKGLFVHDSRKGHIDLTKVVVYMLKNHSETAPVLTILYQLAVTAGYASARCECVFSALTKIDVPQRRRQKTKRETNLTFLHFERKTLMTIQYEDFLRVWESKPRRLNFK